MDADVDVAHPFGAVTSAGARALDAEQLPTPGVRTEMQGQLESVGVSDQDVAGTGVGRGGKAIECRKRQLG